jgi:hypothetical protein
MIATEGVKAPRCSTPMDALAARLGIDDEASGKFCSGGCGVWIQILFGNIAGKIVLPTS